MKPVAMTLVRFTELLAAYGARPARWPDAERDSAEAFALRDAEAARLLADAERLDVLLDGYQVAEASPRLRARVLEVPAVASRRERRRFSWRMAWAVAFSCLIGVASGVLTAPEEASADDEWAELTEVSFYADVDLSLEDEDL